MKKVIIAEDSSVIQNLTRKILQIQNYDITSVKNGVEVMTKMNDDGYDLILMDINMPKMDGMQCAKEIRKLDNKEKSTIPIIAITGNAKNYTMADFNKAGINDYIPKPLNFDVLVETVRKYVESNAN